MILKEASLLEIIASKLHARIHIYIFCFYKSTKRTIQKFKSAETIPRVKIELKFPGNCKYMYVHIVSEIPIQSFPKSGTAVWEN